MRSAARALLAFAVLAAMPLACVRGAGSSGASQAAGSEQPSAQASRLPPPATAADAAARVLLADPRFAGLKAFEPNGIGQCCFYRVSQTADGWLVTIEVGWGDCPAGCINRHTWTFGINASGEVHQLAETGPAVPAGLPGAAATGPSPAVSQAPSGSGGTLSGPGIEGIASAGPTCPVIRPGDSSCADRPVAGATVHVLAADGTEVATLTTDAAGRFAVALEPGDYRLVADPVPGIMHGPQPIAVTVAGGPAEVNLTYDTGIR